MFYRSIFLAAKLFQDFQCLVNFLTNTPFFWVNAVFEGNLGVLFWVSLVFYHRYTDNFFYWSGALKHISKPMAVCWPLIAFLPRMHGFFLFQVSLVSSLRFLLTAECFFNHIDFLSIGLCWEGFYWSDASKHISKLMAVCWPLIAFLPRMHGFFGFRFLWFQV